FASRSAPWVLATLVAVILGAEAGCRRWSPDGSARDLSSGRLEASGESSIVDVGTGGAWSPAATSAEWIVYVFMRTDCPIANGYAPELNRLAAEFSGSSVQFFRVYPDAQETLDSIRRHGEHYAHTTAALWDPALRLADATGAHVTPEAVLVDRMGNIHYRGRIDDRYVDFGEARREPTRRDLELAVRAAINGEPIEVARTRAIGCLIADLR